MKIKFGALVVDGRGKIGGHVASKNRAGAYLRTKVTPVNPNTGYQSAARSRLATLSIAWRGLTDAQRIAWNDSVGNFAKTDIFGDLRKPTGANLFQRLNNNLVNIGETPLDVPPVPDEVGGFNLLTIAAVDGTSIILTFAETPTLTGHALIIRATPAISPGKSFVRSEYRQIEVVAAAEASPYDATTAYDLRFGAVGTAGQKIFVEAFYILIASGQAGIPLQASAIIS